MILVAQSLLRLHCIGCDDVQKRWQPRVKVCIFSN